MNYDDVLQRAAAATGLNLDTLVSIGQGVFASMLHHAMESPDPVRTIMQSIGTRPGLDVEVNVRRRPAFTPVAPPLTDAAASRTYRTAPPFRRALVRYLKGIDRSAVLPMHQTNMGSAGRPDVLFLCRGRAIFFELKSRGDRVRPAQLMYQRFMAHAGVDVVFCSTLGDVRRALVTFFEREWP
jgi:hypothetical protein